MVLIKKIPNETFIIKKEFQKILKKKISDQYINKFYLPIFEKIKNKKKIMIVGPQGSGKTTISLLIKSVLKKIFDKKVIILSLDDFYLKKNERRELAEKIHPLLQVRGVPGTHDLILLNNVIEKLEKKKFPILIPSFNKRIDDRKKNYKKIHACDLVIFEGWCLGASKISKSFLKKDINFLEKKKDPKLVWRNYYNNALEDNYIKIFNKFNFKISFKISSFDYVYRWRVKQEEQLLKKKLNRLELLQIKLFVQYYEKLTTWINKNIYNDSHIIISLNNIQIIEKLIIKK